MPRQLSAVLTGAFWIGLCLAAGGLGSWATSSQISTWYATLVKPSWNPPSWLFAPVWTTLYVLMGVAAGMVSRMSGARAALLLFGVQLVLNVLWSFLFFGWHNPSGAFVEILVLWLAIAATMTLFAGHSRTAAWLLAPYLAWVTFATCLNFTLWRLNS